MINQSISKRKKNSVVSIQHDPKDSEWARVENATNVTAPVKIPTHLCNKIIPSMQQIIAWDYNGGINYIVKITLWAGVWEGGSDTKVDCLSPQFSESDVCFEADLYGADRRKMDVSITRAVLNERTHKGSSVWQKWWELERAKSRGSERWETQKRRPALDVSHTHMLLSLISLFYLVGRDTAPLFTCKNKFC